MSIRICSLRQQSERSSTSRWLSNSDMIHQHNSVFRSFVRPTNLFLSRSIHSLFGSRLDFLINVFPGKPSKDANTHSPFSCYAVAAAAAVVVRIALVFCVCVIVLACFFLSSRFFHNYSSFFPSSSSSASSGWLSAPLCPFFSRSLSLSSSFPPVSLWIFSHRRRRRFFSSWSRVTESTTKCILFNSIVEEREKNIVITPSRDGDGVSTLLSWCLSELKNRQTDIHTSKTRQKFFLFCRRCELRTYQGEWSLGVLFSIILAESLRLFSSLVFPFDQQRESPSNIHLQRDASLRSLTSNLCLSSFICVCVVMKRAALSLSLSPYRCYLLALACSTFTSLSCSLVRSFCSCLFCCVGECWVVVCSRPFLCLASRRQRRRRRLSIEHTYAHT